MTKVMLNQSVAILNSSIVLKKIPKLDLSKVKATQDMSASDRRMGGGSKIRVNLNSP